MPLSINELKDCLLNTNYLEDKLIQDIQKVASAFTKKRALITEYLQDRDLVSAYTVFYFLTNYQKLEKVFEKINLEIANYQDYEFIDIGTGPGTFLFALLEMNPGLRLVGIEKSQLMQQQCKKIVDKFYPEANYTLASQHNSVPVKRKRRLGIFGHSANEMSDSEVLDYIKVLDLDEILFIEPGTSEYFHSKGLLIRQELIKENFNINYPCSSNSLCPMKETNDWCHQYVYLTHDPSVESLCQKLAMNRRLLPLSIQFYSKNKTIEKAVIVQKLKETKGQFTWRICHQENKIETIEVLKRGFSKKDLKKISHYGPGECLEFEVVKRLDDRIRVKLKYSI